MDLRRTLPIRLLPGLSLCVVVTCAAIGLEHLELALAGRAWLEALVLAILVGALVRTCWSPSPAFAPGIRYAAHALLEAAVMLLGATISFGAVAAAGTPLLAGIVATVFATIAASFLLGRLLGLPARMSMLVACGNSICGNSAIAAVAPVIDADSDDVATAIAFTAVLGIAVVLLLPLVAGRLHLSPTASGVLAGLTVYAVPQVLAAAGPMGATAVQVGTLVKLVRVLMLGPVVTVLSLARGGRRAAAVQAGVQPAVSGLARIRRLLPGFIVVFMVLATARSLGLLPLEWVGFAHAASNALTLVAMAGLGLGVDLRQVTAAGPRVSIVVTASLLLLSGFALAVLRLTGIA